MHKSKKTLLLLLVAVVLIIGIVKVVLFSSSKNSLTNPTSEKTVATKVVPSETLKTYTDPAGFIFNYPDNLSLTSNEVTDASYAEVQLSAKGVTGSLNLKITDAKFASVEEWAKSIKDVEGTPKETRLGSLKALEVKVSNELKLASYDQGVLLSIDVTNPEDDFWMKVYGIVLADFSFTSSTEENASTSGSTDDVSFEGEEVIE